MTKAVQKYDEGSVFAVPVGYDIFALGIITRRKPRSPICFGYFFGPPHRGQPTMADVPALSPETAVHRCRFGHLGLRDGDWPVIGRLLPWNRDQWPFPLFYTQGGPGEPTFVVKYHDDNPAKSEAVYRAKAPPEGAIRNSLSGDKAVEIVLRKIFGIPKPDKIH